MHMPTFTVRMNYINSALFILLYNGALSLMIAESISSGNVYTTTLQHITEFE